MYKVFCRNTSGDADCFEFFKGSLEDCIQVALNLHRGCNVEHKISVYDVEACESLIHLFSEKYD